MRTSIASIALIQRHAAGQPLWLAQWNEGWQAYNFVGGHKHDDESFRECLVREIAEELDLRDAVDVQVSAARRQRLEYTARSQRNGEETRYTIELFDVALVGDRPLDAINANPANRWLTEAEIESGRCHDGRPVSPTTKRFLYSQPGMPQYTPQPIDTTQVQLSPEIRELTEKLAENAHDHWATLRMQQGWTFGEQRDDAQKKHPCLIPYADLPDSEKQHDRNTAMETLKAILALGYRIEPA